jgi:uncharacterized membrane protein
MAMLNPAIWGWERIRSTAAAIGTGTPDDIPLDAAVRENVRVARVGVADLRDALRQGVADFGANRTDILVLCILYPVVGLLLARAASGSGLLPLIFPMASGFALLGPIAGLGLYELSRRRERGQPAAWTDMFRVLQSPAIGQIALLALVLAGVFLVWLMAAEGIYDMTLGPLPPRTLGSFIQAVFTTGAGWAMIIVGMGVGFIFAVAAMTISLVSFPLMLDRHVGLDTAIATSVQAVKDNPRTIAVWGLIVSAGLLLGSIPLLLGLAIVLPVLGHATWHLYRKLIKN